ncbi:hypothetical protein [Natronobacterium texcoconense]|uniref:Uncharacterized protein n=1 Tax=Natronobacterium texcoconense TaxID=1095778 RepID=A0A1H1IDP1_NATTX|nr:hypothetical protein [Natronobacterium texcoconense]SDR35780.1 hypothetical protein SAMN04489842_3464 [Natronobacterium texcoconense]
MNRRRVLATFGLIGLSGCLSRMRSPEVDATVTLWNQTDQQQQGTVRAYKNDEEILAEEFSLDPEKGKDLIELTRDIYRFEIESDTVSWGEEFDVVAEEEGVDIFNIHLYDDEVSVFWGVED